MALVFSDVEFQFLYGPAASWVLANPTLKAGEIGFESNTRKSKLGDGTTAWNDLAYLGAGGLRYVKGDVTDHTGTATRTSKFTVTIPASSLGVNGALEVLISARILDDVSGTGVVTAPAGLWLVEVEFGGEVVATFQSFDAEQLHKRCLVQNRDDEGVQVAAAESSRDLTIDTSVDQDVEVFVTLDAADTALHLDLFSVEVNLR